MPNNRIILCGNVDDKNVPWEDKKPIEFRMWGDHWNIRPGIRFIRNKLLREEPPLFSDLLEIATYVYVADQAASRGGEGIENGGIDWYRNLFFRIPVRNPDFWNSQEVKNALTHLLNFMSDDTFHFDFVPLVNPPKLQKYFDFEKTYTPLPYTPEMVMLFSGGLDSLAGAIQESIINHRKVAMIMHRPTDKYKTHFDKLFTAIEEHAKFKPYLFPVRINKQKDWSREYTQRTRSFLYATLGMIFAEMFELSEIRFYENGVVSLNLPIAEQVVGTRATRTTHPKVLKGFATLFSLVADRKIEVNNPFMWKTKKEIIDIIVESNNADLIQHSISCAHVWETDKGKTHCGVCSQCIDRRFAVLAANAEKYDPQDNYSSDLFTSPRVDGENKLMIGSYILLAQKIAETNSPDHLFANFGTAYRALSYFPDRTVDAVATDIFNLYRRHAESIISVIDNKLSEKALWRNQFDPNCLIRLISDSGDLDQNNVINTIKEAPLKENTFKKKGNAWIIRFAGGEEFIGLPSVGMAYIHMLLSANNKELKATEMVKRLTDAPHDYQLGDAGESLDKEAIVNYYAKLQEIQTRDLPKAEKMSDLAEKDRLIRERTWLISELDNRGLHGNRRNSDDLNRIRNRVGNAIKRAIGKIEADDKRLAQHLTPPRLSKGYSLCYMPGEEIEWELM